MLYNGADMLAEYAAHWQAERIISVCESVDCPGARLAAQSVPVTMVSGTGRPAHAEYRAVLDCAMTICNQQVRRRRSGGGQGGCNSMPSAMTPNCTARWTRLSARAWFDELLGRATGGQDA